MQCGDLRVRVNSDVASAIDAPHQVIGHGRRQSGAANQDVNMACCAREKDRGLPRGVSAADYDDLCHLGKRVMDENTKAVEPVTGKRWVKQVFIRGTGTGGT